MNAEHLLERPEASKDVRSRAQLCEHESECNLAGGRSLTVVARAKCADEQIIPDANESKRKAALAQPAACAHP